MDYQNLIDQIKKDLQSKLSTKRYNHVVSVYNESMDLAKIYNVDQKKVGLGAILHDINKENPKQEEEQIIKQYIDNKEFPQDLIRIPPAWHGYTASVTIPKIYNITDKQVLNAIKYHTLGHPEMDDVAKIIYIADFIELTRTLDNLQYYRDKKGVELDKLLYIIHKDIIKYLKSNNNYISKQSLDLLEKLEGEYKE